MEGGGKDLGRMRERKMDSVYVKLLVLVALFKWVFATSWNLNWVSSRVERTEKHRFHVAFISELTVLRGNEHHSFVHYLKRTNARPRSPLGPNTWWQLFDDGGDPGEAGFRPKHTAP